MVLTLNQLLNIDIKELPLEQLKKMQFWEGNELVFSPYYLITLRERLQRARDDFDSMAEKAGLGTREYDELSLSAAECCLINIRIKEALKHATKSRHPQSLYIFQSGNI